MSVPYAPDAARGLRWDDSRLAIEWPEAERRVISERDRAWPDLEDALGLPISEASEKPGGSKIR
jgi:dTDP-4-dehydrorhamnose 3,5-epimerase